jgi:ABC-type nitrate/sulfonate/bicarbonate transport system permease component
MAETRVIASPAPRRPFVLKFGVWQIRLLTVIAALLVWEALSRSGLFYKDVIPPVSSIVTAIVYELIDPEFYANLQVTFAEVAVGFVTGSLVGISAGIMLGSNPYLRGACEPYLNALGATPKIIFLPIIFLFFGVGIESKMAKGALSAFFPAVFSTTLGMMLIDRVLIRVGKSFNLTTWQMITKVYLPAMVGPVVVGLRLSMGVAIIGVLVAEIKFANAGVGARMLIYYDQFKIPSMYAMILILFALAAFANYGMTLLQARFDYRSDPRSSGRAANGTPVAPENRVQA